jgi:hypothetical protein
MVLALCIGVWLILPRVVTAHCDTLDGPVVATAKAALEKKDVTSVLKWVKKEDEKEIREAFKKTLAVRDKGAEAKELEDMYFFETLVRVHRAGEGAPYTGLKPAGTDLGPAVAGADKALENGSVDALVKLVTDAVTAGIREHFAHALEKKRDAEKNVEAGRELVEAYVTFVHYVEGIHLAATAPTGHHGDSEKPAAESGHKH